MRFDKFVYLLGLTMVILIILGITTIIFEFLGIYMIQFHIKILFLTSLDTWLIVILLGFGLPIFLGLYVLEKRGYINVK